MEGEMGGVGWDGGNINGETRRQHADTAWLHMLILLGCTR